VKLKRQYSLSPEDEMRLRRRLAKGCLAAGCLLPILIGTGIYVRSFLQRGGTYIVDVGVVVVTLFVLQRYTVAASNARFELGRDYYHAGDSENAVAALLPFSKYGNRNYDRTGEAHFLLASAAAAVGEKDFAMQMAQFVVRHRKSEWRGRAEELLVSLKGGAE
jgi:hypothetical protein